MLKVILCTWFLAWSSILSRPYIADISFTENIFLMLAVRNNPADDKVLV